MLSIGLSDEMILLGAVPCSRYQAYRVIRAQLPGKVGDIAADDYRWGLLQKLVNLHPRMDTSGWGFALPDDYVAIAGIVEQLDQLNKIDPLPPLEVKTGKPAPIPLKSTGDSYADLISDLTAMCGVEGAIALVESFGPDRINKLITRHNERSIPEEERRAEAQLKALTNWENQQKGLSSVLSNALDAEQPEQPTTPSATFANFFATTENA